MRHFAQTQIIGQVTSDSVTFTKLGRGSNGYSTFEVSVKEVFYDQEGEQHSSIEVYPIIAWDRLAMECATYIEPGSHVFICGKQATSEWVDSEGKPLNRPEIKAQIVMFLGASGGPQTLSRDFKAIKFRKV